MRHKGVGEQGPSSKPSVSPTIDNPMLSELRKLITGAHVWSSVHPHRPMFCVHCHEHLKFNALACDVCKMRAHKKCIDKIKARCKWTVASSIDITEYPQPDLPENVMPHQWVKGNLPMSAKCAVCEKICGSVLKLQDLRCLWCASTVHESCLPYLPPGCSLGDCSLSICPPLALTGIDDGESGVHAQLRISAMGGEFGGGSPLLVLVNLKSGENQGARLLRKLRRLLNPVQVFDLGLCGPDGPLNFFSDLESFRVLVCGGDGTVGWVLSALDRLGIGHKCQVGVLPLGTGNDLARVLGWGHAFYDENTLPKHLRNLERAHTKMLDRWSIMVRQGQEEDAETMYVKSQVELVTRQINDILRAEEPHEVISAAKTLCETIKEFTERTGETYRILDSWIGGVGSPDEDSIMRLCETLLTKLNSLVQTLDSEAAKAAELSEKGFEPSGSSSGEEETAGEVRSPLKTSHSGGSQTKSSKQKREFVQQDALIGRANSLKKAVKEMLAIAERTVDEQNRYTAAAQPPCPVSTKRERFRKKRSRTTPTGQYGSQTGVPTPPGSLSIDQKSLHTQGSLGDDGASTSVPSIIEEVARKEQDEGARKAYSTSPHARPHPLKLLYSSSNLSSSSAAVSPPLSPSALGERLAVMKVRGARSGGAWSETSGVGLSPDRSSASAGVSPDESSKERFFLSQTKHSVASASQALSPTESHGENGGSSKLLLSSPRIGSVEPPTPAETREPSMIIAAQDATSSSRLFKPTSECDLRTQFIEVDDPNQVKQSHSDSSIYEHCAREDTSPPRKQRWLKVLTSGHKKKNHGRTTPPKKNPLLTSGLTGGSLIAEILLLNAKVLGVANLRPPSSGDSPYHTSTPYFKELKVMNNYFGIGLDAKISLDFHNKREELPEKARSRSKLFMWYGMLGGKELVQRTYRNLNQRIELWCDGVKMRLPTLQGLVILNIPSYSGGANFWGTASGGERFSPQNYDDKVLEVVALFGVMHVATSRISGPMVRLQKHRIAQCRNVKIVILGDEALPVQVDGEPWLQEPGVLQIEHKNRAQMIVRNSAFEATLRKWEEQTEKTAPSTPTALLAEDSSRISQPAPFLEKASDFVEFVETEMSAISVSTNFLEALEKCSNAIKAGLKAATPEERARAEEETEQYLGELLDLAEDHFAVGVTPLGTTPVEGTTPMGVTPKQGSPSDDKSGSSQSAQSQEKIMHFNFDKNATQLTVDDPTTSSTSHETTSNLLSMPERWRNEIAMLRMELQKEENARREAGEMRSDISSSKLHEKGRSKSRLASWLKNKFRRKSVLPENVNTWSSDDVAAWVSSLGYSQYATGFKHNEISGQQLLNLQRSDLVNIGLTKESHMKKILNAVSDIQRTSGVVRIHIGADEESSNVRQDSVSAERPSGSSTGESAERPIQNTEKTPEKPEKKVSISTEAPQVSNF